MVKIYVNIGKFAFGLASVATSSLLIHIVVLYTGLTVSTAIKPADWIDVSSSPILSHSGLLNLFFGNG